MKTGIRCILPVLASGLLAASCGPIVQVGGNSKAPQALYTLSATATPSADGEKTVADETLSIDVPAVPGALQTLRIPVVVSDTAVQYLKGASWSEQPNRLFRQLLTSTLKSNGFAVVDRRSSGLSGNARLSGQLQAFGVDMRNGASVRIQYDATLVSDKGMRQRSFIATAPLSGTKGPEVADALNRTANEVAREVQEWLRGG